MKIKTMLGMGCDVGASAIKVVIMKEDLVVGYDITPARGKYAQALEESVNKTLSNAGVSMSDIEYCASTGWGARFLSFHHSEENPIRCLSKGAHWVTPTVRTVIDAGCMNTTAITVNEKGEPTEFVMNDKCGSGSGSFMEMVAEALELKIEDLGALSLSAKERVNITAQCAVFGESEVISYINTGREVADVIAGVSYSISLGISTIVRRHSSVERDIVMTGGVAKNIAVVKALEENIKMEVKVAPPDPQIIGAIGAVLLARARLKV